MHRRVFSLMFVAALSVPIVAHAADPVIDKVDRAVVQPGSVIVITGRNFNKDVTKIRIEVGGKKCMVTQSSDTQVMFVVSLDVKPGKETIILTLGGKKAKYPIEVKEKIDEGKSDGGKQSEDSSKTQLIVVESLSPRGVNGGKTALTVKGKTLKMVDGFKLNIEVLFGRNRIVKSKVEVKGNRFELTFPPISRKLYPGTYTVQSSFQLARQKSRYRSVWLKTASAEDKKLYRRVNRTDFFPIGSDSDNKAESKKLRDAYTVRLESFHKIFEKLQSEYASASRCLFYKNNKVHEDVWKEYCAKLKLCKEIEDLEKAANSTTYVPKNGRYLKDSWKTFLKSEFKKIVAEYQKVERLSAKYVSARFPETDAALKEMASVLVELMINRTSEMLKRSKLKATENPRAFYGVENIPAGAKGTAGRYMQLRNKSLRELNPTKLLGKPDPEEKGK
ncbi:MAG: IPT/TIG domain-containing protein [Planctomycetota bacterium]|nr:IPT/TIG domain-containing protein [Planctomycetota bacterium]